MLLITRLTGQKVIMNQGQIEMRFLSVNDNQVSIGFAAPTLPDIHNREFTLQVGEEIVIDELQIKIRVLFFLKRLVAVGIDAPQQISIDRKEIFLKKRLNLQKPANAAVNAE